MSTPADSPAQQRESSIETSAEYDDFIAKVQAFHDERGTPFEPRPRVGKKQVDLLLLYRRVTSEGGYDAVSDTKSNKLAWRKIGQDFRLGNSTDPTLAFSLKTAYYKNLVAYEIKNLHEKTPPPPSILEEVTAKGGNVLNRTVENFVRPSTREERVSNGLGSDALDSDATPGPARDGEDAGSTGRITRGLRQAPPPRQMFSGMSQQQQRPSRGALPNGQFNSPTPSYSTPVNPLVNSNVPQSLATYEPRPQIPLTLRPVMTPGNNHDQFKADQKRIRDLALSRGAPSKMTDMINRGLILPGTGYSGPSIYVRTLMALQSGILEEQEYALHHLVKISHERGDKYRFNSFPGLAEALIKKVLEIGSLILDVEWQIEYQGPAAFDGEVITDAMTGSPDITTSVRMSKKRKRQDKLEPEMFSRRLTLVNEAGLVLRNMVMLQENAEHLSRFPITRSLLIVLLSLPQRPSTSEIQHYGLELAEQLSGYFIPQEDDQLYHCLLSFVDRNDRGVILASLRSLCRMGTYHQRTARLVNISTKLIQRLCAWIVVEDEELRSASLDFLYQYTTVPENVDVLLRVANVDSLVKQLVRLLLHGARVQDVRDAPKTRAEPAPEEKAEEISIPRISQDHIEMLLGFDEPERSTQWLRACFEEDPAGEITQIALWQAYQAPFTPFSSSRPLLPAKDFITNVSTTFTRASAQVINAVGGGQPKFVIKGIKARRVPVDRRGKKFMRCLWHTGSAGDDDDDGDSECGEFARDPRTMWEHVVTAHLNATKDADGKWNVAGKSSPSPAANDSNNDAATAADAAAADDAPAAEPPAQHACRWAGCTRFADAPAPAFTVGMHVKTHLPEPAERAGASTRARHNRPAPPAASSSAAPAGPARSWTTRTTQVDERGEPAGLPLTSVLILRNVAANVPRTASAAAAGDAGRACVERLFGPVRLQLFDVLASNRSLAEYLPRLVKAVDAGMAERTADGGDSTGAAAVVGGG